MPTSKHDYEIRQLEKNWTSSPRWKGVTRPYKGALLQVRVLPAGFEYDGLAYRSLSAVARAITGSHCNGFLFFRLSGKGGGR